MTIDFGAILILLGMYALAGIFLVVLLPLAIWGTGFFKLLFPKNKKCPRAHLSGPRSEYPVVLEREAT